jgi:hypothetical protein
MVQRAGVDVDELLDLGAQRFHRGPDVATGVLLEVCYLLA